MPKFRAVSGGHVKIFRPPHTATLDIDEGGTYETTDKDEVQALRDSPEVAEVKESAPKRDEKKDD
jgi:hypothetical protein